MDGSVGAQGIELYRSTADDGKILFVFAHTNRVILGTSEGHVLKVEIVDTVFNLFDAITVGCLAHSARPS